MNSSAPSPEILERLLQRASRARVAVLGDFCLDAYWELDEAPRELSVETGLPANRVRCQRYSPGGAGNVAANLAALGVAKVSAIGLYGHDPFGDRLRSELQSRGVDCAHFRNDLSPGWQTPVYAKPMRGGIEGERFDFGAAHFPEEVPADAFADVLEAVAATHDALIVNQQLRDGLMTPAMVGAVNRLAARHPGLCVLVDARDIAASFRGVSLKVNESEAARMVAGTDADGLSGEALAAALHRRSGKPVFVSCGARGLVAAGQGRTASVPGVPVPPPIDPVGAGDCVVSALAATLPGMDGTDIAGILDIARFANLAASVVLKKIGTTGTASPDEIRAAWAP